SGMRQLAGTKTRYRRAHAVLLAALISGRVASNRRVREAERNAPFWESVRKWCVPLALHTPWLNHQNNNSKALAF
ncbi:MAG: hypothetical protein WKF77_18715, partial [Planctomycetaceae bacterium]